MMLAQSTILTLLFAVGALEFTVDNANWAQIFRGLATMALAVAGLVLNAF